jgi:hypothetical protein
LSGAAVTVRRVLRGARDRLRFRPPHAIDALFFLASVYVKIRRNTMPPNLRTDVILRRFSRRARSNLRRPAQARRPVRVAGARRQPTRFRLQHHSVHQRTRQYRRRAASPRFSYDRYLARYRRSDIGNPVPCRRIPGADRLHARAAERRARSVKPEGADYLEKARHCLLGAKTIAVAGFRTLPRARPISPHSMPPKGTFLSALTRRSRHIAASGACSTAWAGIRRVRGLG